jgi:thiol-disulfide isomerase/thioredoxin
MKWKLLLTIVALSVCIGGAYVGYDYLSEKQDGISNLQFFEGGEENLPIENPPAENPSAENPPAENPSGENPPAENPPAENPSPEKPEEEKPQIHPSVPDFTVYDVSGKAVKLSDYFGKPIVLNFFASWCGPCRSEMPVFQAAYDANGDEIVFLFVSLDNTMQAAVNFVEGEGYTFPILHDANQNAADAYGIQKFPTTVFISREGHLVAKAVGALNASNLALGIEKIKG